MSPQDKTAQALKYQFIRPIPDAVTLQAVPLGKVALAAGLLPVVPGGDRGAA